MDCERNTMTLYIMIVIGYILFHSWFVKEFTDTNLRTLVRVDIPIILAGATIGGLLLLFF